MRRCREKGFCCGAGGARMWLEENIGKRVNMERTEEAIGTGADVVSTACPYCMIMLDDAVRANAKEDDVRVLDLSQLLEESMGEPVGRAAPARRPRARRRTEDAPEPSRGAPGVRSGPRAAVEVRARAGRRRRVAGWPWPRASSGRWSARTRAGC